MANLNEIRNRISSVSSTMQITSAMKMVSAAKLKKATDAISQMRPYSDKLTELIQNLSSSFESSNNDNPYIKIRPVKKVLLVAITSNRGLCGGFNSNICRLAKKYFEKIFKEGKNLKIIIVGSKGHDQLKREYGKYIIKKLTFKNKKKISFVEADEVGKIIIDLFDKNEFDKCILFFNNFKNIMTQIPEAQQIIPTEIKKDSKKNEEIFYEFEPDEDEILEDLLPKNISTQVFKAFLENSASEQGSRMTAMDSATRNAGDLVNKLTINYNRSRQAVITKELIEIISGAESL